MATNFRQKNSESKRGPIYAGIGGAILLVAIIAAVFSQRSQPQLAGDEDLFRTVDALFTAVTSRDSQRLAACEERLEKYEAEGRLNGPAASSLDKIVEQAKTGSWEPAAKQLYAFMLGQRRE